MRNWNWVGGKGGNRQGREENEEREISRGKREGETV